MSPSHCQTFWPVKDSLCRRHPNSSPVHVEMGSPSPYIDILGASKRGGGFSSFPPTARVSNRSRNLGLNSWKSNAETFFWGGGSNAATLVVWHKKYPRQLEPSQIAPTSIGSTIQHVFIRTYSKYSCSFFTYLRLQQPPSSPIPLSSQQKQQKELHTKSNAPCQSDSQATLSPLLMPVSQHRGSPADPLRISLVYYALTPGESSGESAGDPPQCDTGITVPITSLARLR